MTYSMLLMDAALKDPVMAGRLERACRLCCETPFVNRQCQALALENTATVLFSRAIDGVDAGAVERAVILARKRLEITEIPSTATQVISGGCLNFKEFELAKQYAEAALKDKPGHPQAAWYLAAAEMRLGNWQRCLQPLEPLQLLEPLTAEMRSGDSIVRLREAARKALNDYLQKQANDPPASPAKPERSRFPGSTG